MEEHLGTRVESGCGFPLIFDIAVILVVAGVAGGFVGLDIVDGLFVAVGPGLFVYAADFLIRCVRPNRLRLDAEILCLTTWQGTRRWPWSAYRGLGGFHHRVLRIETATGQVRLIPIGHWPRGIDARLHDRATRAGAPLPEPSPRPPSATPTFVVAGHLLTLGPMMPSLGLSR